MANSRFAVAPSDAKYQRSTFPIPYRKLDTANFGSLVPFYWQAVLPGDTFDLTTRFFARMSTPLFPVMDDAYIDVAYFFVPMRLVFEHTAEFFGENKLSAWVDNIEYVLPHAEVTPEIGSSYDHFGGIPVYSPNKDGDGWLDQFGLSARPEPDIQFLPLRAYWLIWNDFWRNENTTDPILVNTGDEVTADEITLGQSVLKASKPMDQFTSCLPSPQKGPTLDIPLSGLAPIVHASGMPYSDMLTGDHKLVFDSVGGTAGDLDDIKVLTGKITRNHDTYSEMEAGLDVSMSGLAADRQGLRLSAMYADLEGIPAGDGVSLNELRGAFALQHIMERSARSGSRLNEYILSAFGVLSPDSRLQRPEYLGGSTFRISMSQVTQQSASTESSALGRVGAYSKTISANRDFVHSFTEPGYCIGVFVARHSLSYTQGLDREWSKRGRYDLYDPLLAHISEQPVFKRELFYTGTSSDNEPFGYQEPWFDYRMKANHVCGMFRPTVKGNLAAWHYGDVYSDVPSLDEEWMSASSANVDRTLVVPAATHDQLLCDIAVDLKATRVMPLYGTPGLKYL